VPETGGYGEFMGSAANSVISSRRVQDDALAEQVGFRAAVHLAFGVS
jgi:hypothetical protein